MKKLYSTILFLFVSYLSFAQSNYKNGYIINLKGDTTKGYIDYKEWFPNPKNINFKTALDQSARQLGVSSISCFSIEGHETFQRYVGRISLNPVDAQHATNIADTTWMIDTVFLKVLQKGKNVTLFAYTDDLKPRFYISTGNVGEPQELLYSVRLDINNPGTLIGKKTYVGQLIVAANNAHVNIPDLSDEISRCNYEQNDLVNIVAKINGNKIIKVKKGGLRFFVGAGANYSNLKFSGNTDLALYGNPASSLSPQITIGVDAFRNRDIQKLLLRIDFSFSEYSYTINGGKPYVFTAFTSVDKIKQLNATLTPQIIYSFYNTNTLKIYAGGGVAVNFSTYPTNQTTDYYTSGFAPQIIDNQTKLSSYQISFPVKVGFMLYRKFDIYAGYKSYRIDDGYIDLSGDVKVFMVGVNYLFGK